MRALFLFLLLGAALPAAAENAETLAERLLRDYRTIETVSCEVRKTRAAGERTMRLLSRVHYATPDRVHVENVSPFRRRVVCDGETLYYHRAGFRHGYKQAVPDLAPSWMRRLRTIPGTPMEHLLRLEGAEERELPATEEFPVRRGYETENRFVVLGLDGEGRLAGIDFYRDASMAAHVAQYRFEAFSSMGEGIAVPTVHRAVVKTDGAEIHETSRFNNYSVNEPVPPGLFNPQAFFKGVEFKESFEEVYAEE